MPSSPISPKDYPKAGDFYYHYKHDKTKGINDYAYQILGTALHTENGELLVVYRSLYKSEREDFGTNFFARPLEMFLEEVDMPEYNYNGKRFKQILDPQIIEKLKQI